LLCSGGRKFIPGGRGIQNFLKISLQICENQRRFPISSSKMSFFGIKKSKYPSKMAFKGVHFTKKIEPLN
jgi:hypothetical protein